MGVDWFDCDHCGESWNDCCEYYSCNNCGRQFCTECDVHLSKNGRTVIECAYCTKKPSKVILTTKNHIILK